MAFAEPLFFVKKEVMAIQPVLYSMSLVAGTVHGFFGDISILTHCMNVNMYLFVAVVKLIDEFA